MYVQGTMHIALSPGSLLKLAPAPPRLWGESLGMRLLCTGEHSYICNTTDFSSLWTSHVFREFFPRPVPQVRTHANSLFDSESQPNLGCAVCVSPPLPNIVSVKTHENTLSLICPNETAICSSNAHLSFSTQREYVIITRWWRACKWNKHFISK